MSQRVAIVTGCSFYNSDPPFHPHKRWPELPFVELSKYPNPAFALIRQSLVDLNLDSQNLGTAQWNPMSDFVKEGETVVIKPNFVISRNTTGKTLDAVVTHPSVLRAIVEYVYLALKGRGRIVIADAPQMDCNWEELMEYEQLHTVIEYFKCDRSFSIELYDLRQFYVLDPTLPAYSANRCSQKGDPIGLVTVDLGQESSFESISGNERLYGADYNRKETIALHSNGQHIYHISKTVLSADTVISVPKMKVHKKVGVTLNLKGLVGTVVNKNCLIHYRLGTPEQGGDQLPGSAPSNDLKIVRIQRWLMDRTLAHSNSIGDCLYSVALKLYRMFIKPFKSVDQRTLQKDGGNWSGNDSCWRMTADLAKIFFFASASGQICMKKQRKHFCVVDGIIGGEKDGPLSPHPVPAGCIIAGEDLFAVDIVTTRLIGFDVTKVKQFKAILNGHSDYDLKSLKEIEIVINGSSVESDEYFNRSWHSPVPAFSPHSGWVGQIEL